MGCAGSAQAVLLCRPPRGREGLQPAGTVRTCELGGAVIVTGWFSWLTTLVVVIVSPFKDPEPRLSTSRWSAVM